MEKAISEIHQILQKLVGAHRQLLETIRHERQALVEADLKGIQEATYGKEALVEQVRQLEAVRTQLIATLATGWRRVPEELTLGAIIIEIQGRDPKASDALRSAQNALTILVQRIREQNQENRNLVERSLEHIRNMKSNILRESVPQSDTYTSQGQKSAAPKGARFVSKEA